MLEKERVMKAIKSTEEVRENIVSLFFHLCCVLKKVDFANLFCCLLHDIR